MKTLNPYLTFAGNCREAMEFYKACFHAESLTLMTFGESNPGIEEKLKQRIMHAELKAEAVHIMASDGMQDFTANPGNNVSLLVDLTDENEQGELFSALSNGGKITMPLQDTFWGARYGMLIDRFGIQWMLNCAKK